MSKTYTVSVTHQLVPAIKAYLQNKPIATLHEQVYWSHGNKTICDFAFEANDEKELWELASFITKLKDSNYSKAEYVSEPTLWTKFLRLFKIYT